MFYIFLINNKHLFKQKRKPEALISIKMQTEKCTPIS
jgi:hypothetical protein